MKQLVLATTTILAVGIGVLALWQMHEAVQLLLLALALAAALTPMVQRLLRQGLPLIWAVGLSYALVLASLSLFILTFGFLAYAELVQALTAVPSWYEQTRLTLVQQGDWRNNLGQMLPAIATIADTLTGSRLEEVGARVFGLASGITTWVVLLFAVASLGFYWLLDQQRIERLWLSLLPLRARVSARTLWEEIYREVGIYVRGEIAIALLTVIALTSVYSIVQLPGAVTLALIGGLIQVVPVVGLLLALVPALLIALTRDIPTLLITLGLTLTTLLIIKLVIAPRVFRKGININPVLLLIVILILADIAGLVAILLGPPLAAALQVLARIITSERQQAQRSQTVQVETLRNQLQLLTLRIAPEHPGYPQFQALLLRANKLLDTATANLLAATPANSEKASLQEIGRDATIR